VEMHESNDSGLIIVEYYARVLDALGKTTSAHLDPVFFEYN
jgi:hypothetical protein